MMIEVSAEAFGAASDETLALVIELAREALYGRKQHHDGDDCAKHDPDNVVDTDGGLEERFAELSVGDLYRSDGRWWRIEHITVVMAGEFPVYHVERTLADD